MSQRREDKGEKMNNTVNQAVILAGGRGERLRPFTDTLPKPLYPIAGVPFINRLVNQVKSFGIERVLVLLGYMAEKVEETLKDGNEQGIFITYDITPPEYDTGERLRHAEDLLDDRFLLMYCDNYCPIDYEKLVKESFYNNADIQLSVYSNKDKYTKDNLNIDKKGRIIVYDKLRKTEGLSGVDIGYAIVKKKVIQKLPASEGSFTSVYVLLSDEGKLYGTVTEHRYYSIGSFERMKLTEDFFSGRKAVFIDRDGVLNVRPPRAQYVEKPSEFVWISGAKEAVKLLNAAGIITILFSNQPGVARGIMSKEDLAMVEKRMQDDLHEMGASIDYCYYCLHGWDDGCDCRKPKPGLLYQAQRDLSLNLTECIVFGDDERDMKAGQAAGCRSVYITEEYTLLDAVKDYLKEIGYDYF